MMYSWQFPEWPEFTYNESELSDKLAEFITECGYLQGAIRHLNEQDRLAISIDTLVEEAMQTSAIEGENISKQDLASSILNNLDLTVRHRHVADFRAKGVAELVLLNRKTYNEPLNHEMLFEWHKILLGYRNDLRVIGSYREGEEAMQIVSGPLLNQEVHFEAPPSVQVPKLMQGYVDWFNSNSLTLGQDKLRFPLYAAIAHLYFETIHPFEDGNGRVGRVLIEKALAGSLGSPPLFSVSAAINKHRKTYYRALQVANQGLDLTEWLDYFVNMLIEAVQRGKQSIEFTLQKSRFFLKYGEHLNERQLKAIEKVFAAGPSGFKGGLNNTKYKRINRISPETAKRDLTHLVHLGAFTRHGGGRSTHYLIALE